MIKTLAYIFVPFAVFALTLVGALGMTGHLNMEAFNRLLRRGAEQPAAVSVDEVDAVSRALRERAAELDERERILNERAEQLRVREQDVKSQTGNLQTMLDQLKAELDKKTAEQLANQQEIASSLSLMDPEQAAKVVEELSPDLAVDILRLVKAEPRGQILQSMDPRLAARLLEMLQEPAY